MTTKERLQRRIAEIARRVAEIDIILKAEHYVHMSGRSCKANAATWARFGSAQKRSSARSLTAVHRRNLRQNEHGDARRQSKPRSRTSASFGKPLSPDSKRRVSIAKRAFIEWPCSTFGPRSSGNTELDDNANANNRE